VPHALSGLNFMYPVAIAAGPAAAGPMFAHIYKLSPNIFDRNEIGANFRRIFSSQYKMNFSFRKALPS